MGSGAEATRANYNRLSRWYDLLAARSEGRHAEEGLRRLAVKAGEHVLEIGFGTGRCLMSLARAVGAPGQLSGIDVSDRMLEIARERLRRAGLGDRVLLIRGDAAELPFAPASFDAVFMSFTLELFGGPRRSAVLAECRRVLRAGGRIGVVAMSDAPKGPASRFMLGMYREAHARLPAVIDCQPMDARGTLARAGFAIESTSEASMWGLPVEIVTARNPRAPGAGPQALPS